MADAQRWLDSHRLKIVREELGIVKEIESVAYNEKASYQWALTTDMMHGISLRLGPPGSVPGWHEEGLQIAWDPSDDALREPIFSLYAQISRTCENQCHPATPYFQEINGTPVNYYALMCAFLALKYPELLDTLKEGSSFDDMRPAILYYVGKLEESHRAKVQREWAELSAAPELSLVSGFLTRYMLEDPTLPAVVDAKRWLDSQRLKIVREELGIVKELEVLAFNDKAPYEWRMVADMMHGISLRLGPPSGAVPGWYYEGQIAWDPSDDALREPIFLLYAQIARACENWSHPAPPYFLKVNENPVSYYHLLCGFLTIKNPELLELLSEDERPTVSYYKKQLEAGAYGDTSKW